MLNINTNKMKIKNRALLFLLHKEFKSEWIEQNGLKVHHKGWNFYDWLFHNSLIRFGTYNDLRLELLSDEVNNDLNPEDIDKYIQQKLKLIK